MIYTTKCLLCGDPAKAFRIEELGFDPPNGQVITGGNIPERVQQFHLKLLGHLQKAADWEQKVLQRAHKAFLEGKGPQPDDSQAKHLNAFGEVIGLGALAQGQAILRAFDTQDPHLNQMKEAARLRLNVATRKFYFTNQMIEAAVVQLNLDEQDQQNVIALVQGMRDALLEEGQYAPQNDQRKVIA